ncbi:MAG: D-alanine--D-alanine ligase [Verrucomicrobiota bacterium]|jgi:D-alanine-D-alanine ligase|nr:D-alanine--D-alanine ligase [Verrucomicrobiota bacterium]MDP7176752.1 D-alanine--D-alanine ligase [Verrucomicrobiota bacterium]MDP7292167.1 D-alanine--D-alanine ligase [Verrucomicrobiota bacterium]MDP7440146.1 D-alanine--D-alanine ligase [Verrucomicrobiota bacterium]
MIEPLDICVMLGGPSGERKVSLQSGAAVADALRELGHRVSEIDPVDGEFRLPPNTGVVFLALHGTYGEDGTVQASLDALGVPYTGCSEAVSRLAFDKVAAKRACARDGLATANDCVVDESDAGLPDGLELPLVLKPVYQGSSIGLEFVETAAAWPSSLAKALEGGGPVLVEERIEGREVTVGVVGGQPLPVVEITPKRGAYDYANKYTAGATEYACPALFDAEATHCIQHAGKRALAAVGGGNCARVDFIVRPDEEPVFLEVNTLPGMTETSLLPKAAAATGTGFAELCQWLVELAVEHPPLAATG